MKKLKLFFDIVKLLKNWQLYLADYLNLLNKEYITYYLRNGLKFKINSKKGGRGMLLEIFIYKIYTPKGFEIKKNDLVVDIGANVGIFSVFASKLAKKVYSFEPVNENFQLLKYNLDINKCKNIVPIKKAISDKEGYEKIYLSKQNVGGHSLFSESGNDFERIKTIKLETFMKEHSLSKIDFLKIDCEGAEYKILYSCSEKILKKIGKISMEYHKIKNENIFELKKFLEKYFEVNIRQGKHPMLYAINRKLLN